MLLPLQPRNAIHAGLHPHSGSRIEHKRLPGPDVVQVLLTLADLLESIPVYHLSFGWPSSRVASLPPCHDGHLVMSAGKCVVILGCALEKCPGSQPTLAMCVMGVNLKKKGGVGLTCLYPKKVSLSLLPRHTFQGCSGSQPLRRRNWPPHRGLPLTSPRSLYPLSTSPG